MRAVVSVTLTALTFIGSASVVGAQSERVFSGLSLRAAPPTVKAPSEAIDCSMVKSIDPNFHSNMPMLEPDARVHYTMPIVKAPSCKGLNERGGDR